MEWHTWTEEQINYLKELVEEKESPCLDITHKLNKQFDLNLTQGQIQYKVRQIYGNKPKKPKPEPKHTNRKYTKFLKEYVEYLKTLPGTMTCSEMRDEVNKKFNTNFTSDTVRTYLNRNNITYHKFPITTRYYTEEQIKFIAQHNEYTYRQIIDLFYKEYGIKLLTGSITYVMKRYGISHRSKTLWTKEQEEFLKENTQYYTKEEMMKVLEKEFGEPFSHDRVSNKLYSLRISCKRKIPTNHVGEYKYVCYICPQTIKNKIKEIENCLNTTNSAKIHRDAVIWFLNKNPNERIVTNYVCKELHDEENTNPGKVTNIRLPIDVHKQFIQFVEKNNYKKCDVVMQAILDYSNFVETD